MYDDLSITYLQEHTSRWRGISHASDAQVVERIKQDKIDILVDLSGYTAMNRLRVFCMRPAPITVTAWGYATGTGLPAMQYFLACPVSVPKEHHSRYAETVVDLPSLIPFTGDPTLPEATPLPCLTKAPTFGVFQRANKINRDTIAAWRAILAQVPDSRIVIKFNYSDDFKAWMLGEFGDLGSRVEFWGPEERTAHLSAYGHIDLSLDTFPQTGGVSTCESMWMGVPVLTVLGDSINHRTSAAILVPTGLGEFVVDSVDAYIREATLWVTERKDRLADIRAGLRAQMAQSPVCSEYGTAVERIYRDLWKQWCRA